MAGVARKKMGYLGMKHSFAHMSVVFLSFFVTNPAIANVNMTEPVPTAPVGMSLAQGITRTDMIFGYQTYTIQRSGDVEVLGAVNDDGDEMTELRGQLLN